MLEMEIIRISGMAGGAETSRLWLDQDRGGIESWTREGTCSCVLATAEEQKGAPWRFRAVAQMWVQAVAFASRHRKVPSQPQRTTW